MQAINLHSSNLSKVGIFWKGEGHSQNGEESWSRDLEQDPKSTSEPQEPELIFPDAPEK